MALNNQLINRGGAALDAVKHCQDKMTAEQLLNDKAMRELPPLQWTKNQVKIAEETAYKINNP